MKLKKLLSALLSAAILATVGASLSANAATPLPDPDGNGEIGISDYVIIITYLAGRFEPTDLTSYDFDRNGIISRMDAISVQLYITQIWNGEV